MERTHIHTILFDVTGMSCSACAAAVEKGLSQLSGVKKVSVNLLTGIMSVTFASPETTVDHIVQKTKSIGYTAAPQESAPSPASQAAETPRTSEPSPAQKAQNALRNRLILSVIVTALLFYLSMGDMISWPLPPFLTGTENAMLYALTLFILTLPVLIAGRAFFSNGLKSLVRLAPNMNSLIAIGSGAAFLYGIFALYKIAWGLGHGDNETVHHFAMHLYFESAAMILTLITLGNYLEARAKKRTTQTITQLMNLTPQTAVIQRESGHHPDQQIVEEEIPVEDIAPGDILIIREGSAVPTDGTVTEGYAALDESALTGESLPVEKLPGNRVTGGTVSIYGYLKMKATAVGDHTTLSQIIRLVNEATTSKAPIARLADKISGVFVPVVMAIALGAGLIWLLQGQSFEFALTISISVLVISCPCALGLATPTAIVAGIGRGAAHGIVIKSAEALETLHRTDTIVMDKTGTLTQGQPDVIDILPHNTNEHELLTAAASLENLSNHPLAPPIVRRAENTGLPLMAITEYTSIPGQGIIGFAGTTQLCGGNKKLMQAQGIDTASYDAKEEELTQEGKTVLYFARNNDLLGLIALADTLKPTGAAAVRQLTQMGLEVIMLTGDNSRTAEAVRRQTDIRRVVADVLPQDKEEEIRRLQSDGKRVVMVGDGINDAPALARADIGVTISTGTDIAAETADIVLMKNDLTDVTTAIHLSRQVMRVIKQNLFWAFIYNIIGIPIAAGVFYSLTGWLLSPMIAAAAMSFSSLSVVLNALRLNIFPVKPKQKKTTGKKPDPT